MFVCAGTAGHINPALAIASRIRELVPDTEILFVGSGRPMEKRLVPLAGFELENIKVTGFSRGRSLASLKRNAVTAKNLLISARQSKKLLESFRPDAVIGTGGYVCYPVLNRAVAMGIPTAIHESNAVPGMAAMMLSDKIDRVMAAFPGTEENFKDPSRVTVTGTPVRGDFTTLNKEQARQILGVDERPLVVSFWGSLGAALMNEYMSEFIALNNRDRGFNHIHATGGGEAGYNRMMDMLKNAGVEELYSGIDIRPYIDNMGTVMTAADLILCRAGASTMGEISMMGKPAVMVPSPNVTDNHQEKNARQLEKAGGARVLLEADCSGKLLYETASELVSDPKLLEEMAASSAKLGVPGATDKIVDIVLSLAGRI